MIQLTGMEQLVVRTKLELIDCLKKAGVNDDNFLSQFVQEKVLSRPPFGFLHSLVRVLATSDIHFASNLFSSEELQQSGKKPRFEKLTFLVKILTCVALITGDRVDIFVSPAKVISGEEEWATLYFLRVLARAASTESMIQMSIAASEKVLSLGVSDIYKKTVRLRSSLCLMQTLIRDKLSTRKKNDCSENSPKREALVENCISGAQCSETSAENPNNSAHSDMSEIKPTTTINPVAPRDHSNLPEQSFCCDAISGSATKCVTVSTADGVVRSPMKSDKDFAACESQRKLEIDRKKIFRLQHKLRQTAHKLHEREELLQLREAALDEKESRTARLAEQLKRQQTLTVLQLKKNNEILNLSKQNGGGVSESPSNAEEKNLHLKEREERISRLEKKLQKLQSRLLKKQQEQEIAMALRQSSSDTACVLEKEVSCNEVSTVVQEYRSQSIQTDCEGDEIPCDHSVDSPLTLSASTGAFVFCNDTQVFYTRAIRKKAASTKDRHCMKSRPRSSRRRHRLTVSRKKHTVADDCAPQRKQESEDSFNEQKYKIEDSLNNGQDFFEKKRKKNVRFEHSTNDDKKKMSNVLEDEQKSSVVDDGSGSLQKSRLKQRSILSPDLRDTASGIATRSLYSNYKFSFDSVSKSGTMQDNAVNGTMISEDDYFGKKMNF